MTFVLHTTGPVALNIAGTPPTTAVIGGVRSLGASLGSQVKGEPSSGEIFARLAALYGQKPAVHFTAEDIQGALTACGPKGIALSSEGTTLTLYGSKLKPGGGIDSSGHVSITCPLGILFPKTLSCAHRGDAEISYEAMLYTTDGIADPFTLSTSATLPTIASYNRWTLDTCEIAGVPVTQQMSVSVDFGVRCFGEGSDSSIRDEIVSIQSIEPKITVTSSQQGNILASLLGASGAFSLVLRNRTQGGSFGTGTITLAATAGLAMQETPFQASGHRPGDVSLSGHLVWDGINDPLTFGYAAGGT